MNAQTVQKNNLMEQIKAEALEEKADLQARYNALKLKSEDEEDKSTTNRIDFERERALKS
jgi:hypothetical protein